MKEQVRRPCYEPGAAGVVCLSSMMRRLCFELLLKSLQIVSVDIGNGPVVKVRVSPVQKLIALARYRLRGFSGIGRGQPDEEVNEMLTPLVNQYRHRPVIEIIKTATD